MSEEFRINEPESKGETLSKLKRKVDNARGMELALKSSLIERKAVLDMDSFFQVSKNDISYCTLTDVVPCRNPHCMSCNMVLIKQKDAMAMINYIGSEEMSRVVRVSRESMSREQNDRLDNILEDLLKEVDKDD